MGKTSHTSHKHSRRKAIAGLTPAAILADMAKEANGKTVRKVRGSNPKGKQVLSEAREGAPAQPGRPGIFGTAPGNDAERTGAGKQETVSDAEGSPSGETFQVQLSRVLKRMLGEQAPLANQDETLGRMVTNAEALAAVVQREAFIGKQWACEFWRDMAEGKPVRAAQQNNNDQEVEDQLDRVSLAALNRLAEKKD